MSDLKHYWVTYSSSEWVERTVIQTSSEPYKDAEDWALKEENLGDENIQVTEFKEITGAAAVILNVVNGRWRGSDD